MSQRGCFITLEGGEGTGKSTQMRMLQQSLAAAGVDAVFTREPGGTPEAERIRDLVVQRDGGKFDSVTEALLMFASRREHVVNKIRPALDAGKWVISDRFADSSRAFQGCGLGVAQKDIEALYKMTVGELKPDLTFIFDIEPEAGLARSLKQNSVTSDAREATEDKYERLGIEFHRKLRQGFLDIAKAEPGRCVIVDATQSIVSIHDGLLAEIGRRFDLSLKRIVNG